MVALVASIYVLAIRLQAGPAFDPHPRLVVWIISAQAACWSAAIGLGAVSVTRTIFDSARPGALQGQHTGWWWAAPLLVALATLAAVVIPLLWQALS